MNKLLASGLAASIPLIAVTGCSADKSDDQSSNMSRPAITASPTATSLRNSGLPLDAYMMTGQQLRQWRNAASLLEQDCMERFGISYSFRRSDAPIEDQSDRAIYVWPIEKARQYGYRVPVGNGLTDKDMHSRLSNEQASVMTGILGGITAPGKFKKATAYNGMKIPEGGCAGEAYRRLGISSGSAGGGENILDSRTQMLRAEAAQRASTDPKVLQVITDWSACMKQAGYDYKTPADAANGVLGGQGSPAPRDPSVPADQREIQTAVTDMTCKAKVKYVGTIAVVRSAYEQQQVEQHGEELKNIRTNIDLVMRNASDVLSGRK